MTEITTVLQADLTGTWLRALRGAARVAWDIETTGLDWRVETIGTCQLHAPEVGSVVVQINGGVPEGLRELLVDESVQKVFHHAAFDLRFMSAHWKLTPASVACTKIASKLLTPEAPREHHSLQWLLADQLGVEISKRERLSDWRVAELTADQLAYAVADVQHLLPLLDGLSDRLRVRGLYQLFEDCLRFLPARVDLDLGGYGDVFTY